MHRIVELLPCRHHPAVEDVERESLSWFNNTQLVDDPIKRERILRSEFSRGVAAAFPRVHFDAALLWARFTLWYMTFEDTQAEGTAAQDIPNYFRHAGDIWRTLHDAWPQETPEGQFPTVLRQLLDQLDTLAAPTIAAGVREGLRDYLFASAWEAVVLANDTALSPGEYVSLRRHAGFLALNMTYLEISPNALLDHQARRSPEAREARAAASDLLIGINDLYSHRYEEQTGSLLRPAQSNPEHSPTRQAVELADSCLTHAHTVARLRDATITDPSVSAFCTAAADWAAGTIWWQLRVRNTRYPSR